MTPACKYPPQPSRRQLVAGAAAAAAFAAVGAGTMLARGPRGLVLEILRRGVGPITMRAEDRERFIGDVLQFARSVGARDSSMRILGAGYSLVNVQGVRALMSDQRRFGIEQFERQVVTFFLLTTDYLQCAGRPETTISYHGLVPGCISPWAKFD